MPDLVFARIGILLQKLMGHQHEAGRAEAALERAAVDEGLLHGDSVPFSSSASTVEMSLPSAATAR